MSNLDLEKKMFKGNILKREVSVDSNLEHGYAFDVEDENIFIDNGDGPDFRGVSCLGGAVLIAKIQFGLGVLGLPQTFQVLGFVPGLISLIGLCILSTWAGFVIGKFRLSHPQVHNVGDAAYLMFGKYVGDLFGFAFWLQYTLLYGAAVLTLSIAFNTFSDHAICTTAFVGISAVMALIAGLVIRTMKVLSWCGYVAVISVFLGVWVVAIACLTQDTPAAAPKSSDPVNTMIQVVATGSSYSAISGAVATQVLSLCGTPSFFIIHAEMKDQTKYVKSLLLGQGFVAFNYIVISCIVYGKVGQYVASPSLGSAGMLIQKVAYGVSFPALFFACFFQAHLSAKYALVRILKGSVHLQSNSKTHWITWISMMTLVIAIGFVVAGAIPFFDDLLGLIGALLGTSFTLIIPAFMALYQLGIGSDEPISGGLTWMKRSQKVWRDSRKNTFTVIVAFFAIVSGVYISISGVYGTITSIVQSYADGTISSAFSCADNSR